MEYVEEKKIGKEGKKGDEERKEGMRKGGRKKRDNKGGKKKEGG